MNRRELLRHLVAVPLALSAGILSAREAVGGDVLTLEDIRRVRDYLENQGSSIDRGFFGVFTDAMYDRGRNHLPNHTVVDRSGGLVTILVEEGLYA